MLGASVYEKIVQIEPPPIEQKLTYFFNHEGDILNKFWYGVRQDIGEFEKKSYDN